MGTPSSQLRMSRDAFHAILRVDDNRRFVEHEPQGGPFSSGAPAYTSSPGD